MHEPWRVVEHNWSDTSIYAGNKQIALLSIADEATEETQEQLEAEMAEHARLIAAAPDLFAACAGILALYDAALATGESVTWKGELVDSMRAAVNLAKGD